MFDAASARRSNLILGVAFRDRVVASFSIDGWCRRRRDLCELVGVEAAKELRKALYRWVEEGDEYRNERERRAAHRRGTALAAVDAAKRETLRKLILGAAFVVPVVASFLDRRAGVEGARE